MKKAILLAVLLILGIGTSQAQLLKFGVKGGLNFANYTGGDVEGYDFKTITSYHAGVVAEIKLFENFALQPELLYSTQGSKNLKLEYLSVPVLLKFYMVSDTFSFELGPQFSVLINDDAPKTFDSKTADLATVFGLGYNLTDTIFVQGRYVYGVSEISKNAEIKNRVIQFSVGLRF